jgi:hypothetical protein
VFGLKVNLENKFGKYRNNHLRSYKRFIVHMNYLEFICDIRVTCDVND